jgi:hypothetical protein
MLVDGRELSRRVVALTDGLYVFEVQSTVCRFSYQFNITHDGVEHQKQSSRTHFES